MSGHSWGEGDEAPGVQRCHERGLEAVRVVSASGSLLVFRQGAHVAEYQPGSGPGLLWLSSKSRFERGAAIRGGVPICFPWFGAHPSDPKLPAHGFARTSLFAYLGSQALTNERIALSFELCADQTSRALWPADFRARLRVTLGDALELEFSVRNTGPRELDYEEALHTYFSVGDVRQIAIHGLLGAPYADKVTGTSSVQDVERLTIASETDRVYESTKVCRLVDPGLSQQVVVDKNGSATTVVWNPLIEKARRLSDFADDEYLGMVCIESANTHGARIVLAPGQEHSLFVRLCREPLEA
ncbi:MAG TPA: D-hexose-6-phosphate mutarotase [Polyangiaceae bacterium]|nr:D-hexose-6-phosphate mutarotase [Polyangiaceae bacterium]